MDQQARPGEPPIAAGFVRVRNIPPYEHQWTDIEDTWTVKAGGLNLDSKPSNPKDAAATNRLDLSLFPATARAYGALAMVEGDQKYGGYNYRNAGVNASVYYAAACRHLDKWYNGEEDDPKTGVPHLANAIGCLAVLIEGVETGNWTDDRPPRIDLTRLLNDFEQRVGKLKELFPRRVNRFTEKNDSK